MSFIEQFERPLHWRSTWSKNVRSIKLGTSRCTFEQHLTIISPLLRNYGVKIPCISTYYEALYVLVVYSCILVMSFQHRYYFSVLLELEGGGQWNRSRDYRRVTSRRGQAPRNFSKRRWESLCRSAQAVPVHVCTTTHVSARPRWLHNLLAREGLSRSDICAFH